MPGQILPSLRLTIRKLVNGELPWPLLLHGPPGTGKTCAALCLLDHAGGEYATLSGLCDHLIACQNGRVSTYQNGQGRTIWPENVWKVVESSTIVVTDEIGTGLRERPTPFQYDTLKKLLDLRFGFPAIFIANLNLEALQRLYDDRIVSRLAAGTVVLLDGPDRRLQY